MLTITNIIQYLFWWFLFILLTICHRIKTKHYNHEVLKNKFFNYVKSFRKMSANERFERSISWMWFHPHFLSIFLWKKPTARFRIIQHLTMQKQNCFMYINYECIIFTCLISIVKNGTWHYTNHSTIEWHQYIHVLFWYTITFSSSSVKSNI